MKYYAQLNESDICIGVSMLKDEVNQSNMIKIDSMNEYYMWQKYENGEWSGEKYSPIVEEQPYEPTNAEINANLMVVMSGIVDIYMAQLGL